LGRSWAPTRSVGWRFQTHPPSEGKEGPATFVVEDRSFNTKARLNAFAGRPVVKSIEYVEVGGANALSFGDKPLPTTLVRFGRPGSQFAASFVQKVFSNNRGSEVSAATEPGGGTVWTGFETTRTLFYRTTGEDAPPVVTDNQIITQLRLVTADKPGGGGGAVVKGRVRIADYLTPNDQLYFDAKQRAVSISDYDITLTRRPPREAPAAVGDLAQERGREKGAVTRPPKW